MIPITSAKIAAIIMYKDIHVDVEYVGADEENDAAIVWLV
jgi:hypothetical protein